MDAHKKFHAANAMKFYQLELISMEREKTQAIETKTIIN